MSRRGRNPPLQALPLVLSPGLSLIKERRRRQERPKGLSCDLRMYFESDPRCILLIFHFTQFHVSPPCLNECPKSGLRCKGGLADSGGGREGG